MQAYLSALDFKIVDCNAIAFQIYTAEAALLFMISSDNDINSPHIDLFLTR